MKAFVIKNKEGKYIGISSNNYEHYWTTLDFAYYWRFLDNVSLSPKEQAETFRNNHYPDCEVVEITIAEDGLEQQLAEKDKEIEKLKNFMSKWHFENFESFENHYNYLMSLKNREQLMVENEAMKETIANLLGQKKTSSKEIRKQVCEEIRNLSAIDVINKVYIVDIEILDKVEKGE